MKKADLNRCAAAIIVTHHSFRIRPFGSRTAINNDIVANSFWSPRISYSSQMACVSCPSPTHNGPMWLTTTHSIQSNNAMRMRRKELLAPNRPSIPMVHWLATTQRKWCREPSRICKLRMNNRRIIMRSWVDAGDYDRRHTFFGTWRFDLLRDPSYQSASINALVFR